MSSSASQHPQLATKDAEHLHLLSVFYWVLAGLAALGGCASIVLMLMLATRFLMDSSDELPPWIGGMLVAIGLASMLLMWAVAAALGWAGKCLRECRHWTYCIAVAGIACLNVPLGTILGVMSITVLMRENVKKAFVQQAGR